MLVGFYPVACVPAKNLARLALTWPGWLVCQVGQVVFPKSVTDPDGNFADPDPRKIRRHRVVRTEIPAKMVGELVMEGLYALDQVAYVRFASVYRNFREAKDFEEFLGEMSGQPDP